MTRHQDANAAEKLQAKLASKLFLIRVWGQLPLALLRITLDRRLVNNRP